MKTQLVFLALLVAMVACKKEENISPSKIFFSCYGQEKLNTGEIIDKTRKAAIVQFWDAKDRKYSINSSDAISGYAYDSISGTSIKSFDSWLFTSDFVVNMNPGTYFVFVMLNDDQYPEMCYSYEYFTVKSGENIDLKKVFKYGLYSTQYDPW